MKMKTIKLVYAFVELARAGSDGEWYVPLALSGAPELLVVSRLFVETRTGHTADGALICIRDDYAEYRPVFGKRAIEVACAERGKCERAQDYEGAARLADAVIHPLRAFARKCALDAARERGSFSEADHIFAAAKNDTDPLYRITNNPDGVVSEVSVDNGKTWRPWARAHATKTETATTGGANGSFVSVEDAIRSWATPTTKTQAQHHLGIGEMHIEASVEAPSAASVGPLNVRPVHGPDVVFSIVEGVKCLSDVGRRVYRKPDETLTLGDYTRPYVGYVVKVLNEHGECMVAFGPDPLKPSSTATPRSVEVDFEREVPNRLTPAPAAPLNPRPRCDYSSPVHVGEPVKVPEPDMDCASMGCLTREHPERTAYHRAYKDGWEKLSRDLVSHAVRTMRSLPVCAYGGMVHLVAVEYRPYGHLQLALVCDKCSKREG